MTRSPITAVLRSDQAYFDQISQRQQLECGLAFYSSSFPYLAEANHLADVVCLPASQMESAFEGVNAFFAEFGARCFLWRSAEDQSAGKLGEFLTPKGFSPRVSVVMALTAWGDLSMDERFRILPARAVKALHRRTFSQSGEGDADATEALADAGELRLDDPRIDVFIATVDGQPAGRCSLLQVGDIANIKDLAVVPTRRRQGVGTALLRHCLQLAQRLAMKTICLSVHDANAAGLALFEKMGFSRAGEIVDFQAPEDPKR